MEWFFLCGLIGITSVIIIYSYLYEITPTPTSKKVQKHLLSILPKMMNVEIVELGSGWGTMAFALARQFPNCQVTAYEASPIPYLISTMASYLLNFSNLSIKRQNFFEVSLENAALVFCYLYPKAMERLRIKFEKDLAPNAYVITHTFAVPGWFPLRLERAADLYHTPIYLYQT